jgi:transposase
MYVLSTGCQWRAIPKDLPPKSTVYDYFDLWTYDGTLRRIHHALQRPFAAMAGAPREKVKNNPMQGRSVKIHAAS